MDTTVIVLKYVTIIRLDFSYRRNDGQMVHLFVDV